MRSRTPSESKRTSMPSTKAEPPLSGSSPVSILMTVVFPLPFGPRKPKISPFSTRKLTSLTAVKLPKRRTRCSAEMAASLDTGAGVAIPSAHRFEFHVGSHSWQDSAGWIVDADFYAEDLVNSFLAGLHVAWKKLRLLVDLFHFAVENRAGKRVHADFCFLTQLDAAVLGFGNVNPHIDLILFEKR